MSAKHCPTFLSPLALLSALTLPGATLGQQTAEKFVISGEAKIVKQDWDGATANLTKAIELNPKYVEAYKNRGLAKNSNGDKVGAIADYSKAIDLDPKDASAYFNRGGVKKAKGDLDGSIADYSKAIELNPKYAHPYMHGPWQCQERQGRSGWCHRRLLASHRTRSKRRHCLREARDCQGSQGGSGGS